MELLSVLFPSGFGDPEFRVAIERSGGTPHHELVEFVGCCAWDILSHNHGVIGAGGEDLSLGSFRTAAAAIAQHAERFEGPGGRAWDYMDFLHGTRWVRPPADVAPACQAVYQVIFSRMRAAGIDWRYYRPVAQVEQPGGSVDGDSDAIQEIKRSLMEAYRKAEGPPEAGPLPIILAYRTVFGADPLTL